MQAKLENVRSEVPLEILVKWTGVSAVLHALLIGALCGVSYLGFQAREAKRIAKLAADEAAAKADDAAKAAKAAATPPTNAVAATPEAKTPDATAPDAKTPDVKPSAPAPQPGAEPPKPVQAETILGIDKVAKPDEIPKSPFSSKGDDLL